MGKLKSKFSKDLGIDLGTKNTVVYAKGKGIILREPSMVAIDKNTKEVMAIGNEAYNMVGRTPSNIIAVRPMKDGVIADFEIAEKMVQAFIEKANMRSHWNKPRVLIGIPWGITAVEKRAVSDAARRDAKQSLLIEEPMAAAIGAHLPIESASGCMIIDIGGGTTEVAVICLSGIVVCKSIRIAGDEFDEAIVSHCRKHYNLQIGENMAEQIKIEIGSAIPFEKERSSIVKGRDILSGLPRTFTISSMEIRDSLSDPLDQIAQVVRQTLETTPPELSADIMKEGIFLTGGGALLYGIDQFFSEHTNLKVSKAEDPLSCVAIGTGMVLEKKSLMRKISSSITK
ncbi:rod shape-determining protein [Candidatus Marinamargulisbacteria bacterium SCGC AAA071-K20]|nr:rod shape-determining protein [Candidatus Marinamargulisbacteria bacterium SCGC AAA071-K20]